MTRVMFVLYSISSGLEFWSVHHTSIYENSESKVFKNFQVKYLIIDQKIYWKEMFTLLLNFIYNYYWQYYNVLILFQ